MCKAANRGFAVTSSQLFDDAIKLKEQSSVYYSAASKINTIIKLCETQSCSPEIIKNLGKIIKNNKNEYLRVIYFKKICVNIKVDKF